MHAALGERMRRLGIQRAKCETTAIGKKRFAEGMRQLALGSGCQSSSPIPWTLPARSKRTPRVESPGPSKYHISMPLICLTLLGSPQCALTSSMVMPTYGSSPLGSSPVGMTAFNVWARAVGLEELTLAAEAAEAGELAVAAELAVAVDPIESIE